MEAVKSFEVQPTYTVVERQRSGLEVVTSVILGGEMVEFHTTESTRRAVQAMVVGKVEEL